MAWQTIVYVGLGGFCGANARYWVSLWVNAWISNRFGWQAPFGTALVNVTGSCLLAMFLTWASLRANLPDQARWLIGSGFFGAYTTFSTYANESVALLTEAAWWHGVAYIIITNGLCLLGVLLGIAFVNWITAAS